MTPIFVSKPPLPKIEDYISIIQKIWDSNYLTNNGPLLIDLEKKIAEKYKIKYLKIVTNGTIALQLAVRALIDDGVVLTTPFSFVATSSVLAWDKLNFEFIDIDRSTFNVSIPLLKARLLKGKVSAVVFTHVFGNPCNVEEIESLSREYGFRIIYDAAHAFGMSHLGTSIFHFGDISITSLHATKVFHTVEGGIVASQKLEVHEKILKLLNFGINPKNGEIDEIGINGKISEFHAAMGLALFPEIDAIIEERRKLYQYYKEKLSKVKNIQFQKLLDEKNYNAAYMPVVLKSEKELLRVVADLHFNNIVPRRYFYPSLNELSCLRSYQPCPTSEDISRRILCLPLFVGLEKKTIDLICKNLIS